jgi:hypothetical protein
VLATDSGIPLCTWAQFTSGAFSDLARNYTDPTSQSEILLEASRECETVCDRRLIPFTNVLETQRADALDVEDALDAYVPLDPTAQLGMSRAASLGSTLLVRHFWVREAPPRFTEMWTGSLTSVQVRRSFSGTQTVDPATCQFEPDTGHVRFQLGTFVPPGTTIMCTYSGGYTTTPANLVRAGKLMTAWIVVRELAPSSQTRDPGLLYAEAVASLAGYTRQ